MWWWFAAEPLSVRLIKELIAHPLFIQRKTAAEIGYPTTLPLTVAELLVSQKWDLFFTTLATDAGRIYVRSDQRIAQEVFALCQVHKRSELFQIFPSSPPHFSALYDPDYCQLDQTLPRAYDRFCLVMREFDRLPGLAKRREIAERGFTEDFRNSMREFALRGTVSAPEILDYLEQFVTSQGLELLRSSARLRGILAEKLSEYSRHHKLLGNLRLEHVYRRCVLGRCVSDQSRTFLLRSESNVQANDPSPSQSTQAPNQGT